MNCRNAEQGILLAETGELSGRKLRKLEAHVTACAACAQYRRSAVGLVAAARKARPAAEPGQLAMTRIRAAAAQRPVPGFVFLRQPVVQALACAAAVAILAGGWFACFPGASMEQTLLNDFSAIIHAAAETTPTMMDARNGSAREQEVRTLAGELLAMEGLLDELVVEIEPPNAEATSDEELSPTALRWRNSPASLLPVCG